MILCSGIREVKGGSFIVTVRWRDLLADDSYKTTKYCKRVLALLLLSLFHPHILLQA